MPQPIVLISDRLPAHITAELGADFEIRHCNGADRRELLAAVPNAAALLIRSGTRIDQEVLDAARQLKIVARAGVGLDNVDVDAATQAGVLVANAPASNAVSVAELAMGLIISSCRSIPVVCSSVRSGSWVRSLHGMELAGKTVGILGFGRIGRLVAARLTAFDVRTMAYDPYVSAEEMSEAGLRNASLAEVMRQSDVITIHLPLTPETRGLVGETELALAKPSLRLVNTARGGIVDEVALYRALKDGRLAGAALDVFEAEPPGASPLLELDSVIATSHIGASTHEAQERAGREAVAAVRAALTGQNVPGQVNRPYAASPSLQA